METETLWNKFDEDRKSLDSKLTAAERELSHCKADDMTFQQMKDVLPILKVITLRCSDILTSLFFLLYNMQKFKMYVMSLSNCRTGCIGQKASCNSLVSVCLSCQHTHCDSPGGSM